MKTEPERSCIVTREVRPKVELMRFVVGPGGQLVADLAGKLPGRGIYVTGSKLLIGEAIVRRLFSRAAGEQVSVPEDFLARLEAALIHRVAEALSLARKSGAVIGGYEKIEEALRRGKVAALIHAADAAGDSSKLDNLAKKDEVPTSRYLARELLSEVLGKPNAAHAAVLKGPAAAFFLETSRRFAFFLE